MHSAKLTKEADQDFTRLPLLPSSTTSPLPLERSHSLVVRLPEAHSSRFPSSTQDAQRTAGPSKQSVQAASLTSHSKQPSSPARYEEGRSEAVATFAAYMEHKHACTIAVVSLQAILVFLFEDAEQD